MQARSIPFSENATAAVTDYSQHPGKLWSRRLTIISSLFSFCILLIWDWLTGRLLRNHHIRAIALRQKLIQMGPTFIKLGQVLSCRPDLIPPVYVEELANLQDKLPPFPNEQAYQVIEEELGCSYDQIYAELNPQPVAAASLGQVYQGKLKTGEMVALKVQRPGVIDVIALDIYLLRQLAAWVQKNISFIHSDLVGLSDELATSLLTEIDYVQEGLNADRFAQLYGHVSQICVPKIYWQYTKSRVLTMEWINGVKLTSTEALRAQGSDPTDLISIGFKFSLQQLLEGGFFHADPHPGNLLVTADGKLAYLDFGMMSKVPPETCDLLIISLLHMISGDFEALAQDYVLLEFLPPETDLTPLIPQLAEIFGNIREASVAEFGFKQSFEKLLNLVYEYSWQVPTFYLLVFRCFATLEGIVLKINPDFKAYKVGYPYIAKWVLTKGSPRLWNALRNFWLSEQTIQWELVSDLLENIYKTDDFNLNHTLEQLLEFLYSSEGNSLRYALVNEAATSIENLSQSAFNDFMVWTGTGITPFSRTTKNIVNLDTIKQLLEKLLSVNAMKLISIPEIVKFILRPETQHLQQEIVSEIGRRFSTNFIKNIKYSWFLSPE